VEITRQFVLVFTFVFGPLVLASYAYGASHADRPADLWGGIPPSWQGYIVPFMFLAAIGFLIYWYTVFFHLDEASVESLRWPWGNSDGEGGARLLLSLSLILIPSALWMESTIFHLENEYSWTPVLVIGMLFLTSVGNLMLGLLGFSAYQDGVDGAGLMIIGSVMLGVQCILNDFFIWVYKFPW